MGAARGYVNACCSWCRNGAIDPSANPSLELVALKPPVHTPKGFLSAIYRTTCQPARVESKPPEPKAMRPKPPSLQLGP